MSDANIQNSNMYPLNKNFKNILMFKYVKNKKKVLAIPGFYNSLNER